MAIIVMICYARSGGTILNQCLGALENVIIISEVNPSGGGRGKGAIRRSTIKEQARHWYGIDLESDIHDFRACALELEKACEKRNKYLIIRDWSYGGFKPNIPQCPDNLPILEVLKNYCEISPFGFVRNGIDVWLSLRKTEECSLAEYADSYLAFVKAIKAYNMPIFKYEDFTSRPGDVIGSICENTNLPFSSDFQNYNAFHKVNGDVQFGKLSRGGRRNSIKPLPRRAIAEQEIQEIEQCSRLKEANGILGYSTSYEQEVRENFIQKLHDDLWWRLAALSRRVKVLSRRF